LRSLVLCHSELNPARTILAVLLGYLALIILEVLGGGVLYGMHLPAGSGAAIIGGEIVVFISGIIAGAITARVAPSRPLSHASALALAIVSATAVATALLKPPVHHVYPVWYSYALGVFSGIGAFTGGVLVQAVTQERQGG
jgi:hypothetical protein